MGTTAWRETSVRPTAHSRPLPAPALDHGGGEANMQGHQVARGDQAGLWARGVGWGLLLPSSGPRSSHKEPSPPSPSPGSNSPETAPGVKSPREAQTQPPPCVVPRKPP